LRLRAINVTRGTVLADRLKVAENFRDRLVGLLGRSSLEGGEALWLSPCRSIHTFGMRFPIDALFLDSRRVVVRTVDVLPPRRARFGGRGAASVIELPAGTVARTGTKPGDRIDLIEDD
jgi:uncharacterized membrane protein (UPF0127 family)